MLGPSEAAGALGALGTQQAAPRPSSPGRGGGGRSFPVSHFGVGPREATQHCPQGPGGHFLGCPFWGAAGCPAWCHPWPPRERRHLEVLGSGPLVLGSPRQLWRGAGGRGCPGSHLRLPPPPGFLSDSLSSSLGSSRAERGRQDREPGVQVRAQDPPLPVGSTANPHLPTTIHTQTHRSLLLPAPGLS